MSDLKERCRKVMMEVLEKNGYPNLTRKGILLRVKDMWNALDVAGLLPEVKAIGHSYETFCDAAVRKAQESAFDEYTADLAAQMSAKRRTK